MYNIVPTHCFFFLKKMAKTVCTVMESFIIYFYKNVGLIFKIILIIYLCIIHIYSTDKTSFNNKYG